MIEVVEYEKSLERGIAAKIEGSLKDVLYSQQDKRTKKRQKVLFLPASLIFDLNERALSSASPLSQNNRRIRTMDVDHLDVVLAQEIGRIDSPWRNFMGKIQKRARSKNSVTICAMPVYISPKAEILSFFHELVLEDSKNPLFRYYGRWMYKEGSEERMLGITNEMSCKAGFRILEFYEALFDRLSVTPVPSMGLEKGIKLKTMMRKRNY